MALLETKHYTVDEFESFIALPENRDRRFELINGEIVEKMPTREHGIIAGNFVTEFNLYLRKNPIGYAAVEARHRVGSDTRNDRLPDVSFVSDINKPIERSGAALYMPDICVKIKSPHDTYKEMLAKAEYYLANGARMVWLVYPEKRLIEVLTLTDRQLLSEDEALTGGDVLPGFAVRVGDLFPNAPATA